uniref:Uncharacterized protein LOC105632512 isoform X2 n=1 Tax=Rhizophora mucronata TaxID=61149 RepID=A0A2P2M676_RHIMU
MVQSNKSVKRDMAQMRHCLLLYTFKSLANFRFSSTPPFLQTSSFKAEVIISFSLSSMAILKSANFLCNMFFSFNNCISLTQAEAICSRSI